MHIFCVCVSSCSKMEDDFSQSLTPPVSPFVDEELGDSSLARPPCFSCAFEKGREEAQTLSSDGYVSRGALKRYSGTKHSALDAFTLQPYSDVRTVSRVWSIMRLVGSLGSINKLENINSPPVSPQAAPEVRSGSRGLRSRHGGFVRLHLGDWDGVAGVDSASVWLVQVSADCARVGDLRACHAIGGVLIPQSVLSSQTKSLQAGNYGAV